MPFHFKGLIPFVAGVRLSFAIDSHSQYGTTTTTTATATATAAAAAAAAAAATTCSSFELIPLIIMTTRTIGAQVIQMTN